MFRRSIIVSLASVLAVVSLAAAQEPEAPKVISWSNSKTGDRKTCLLVSPGEKVTFSVKSEGAERYLWQVDKRLQKPAKAGSFAWTVPNKKGLWKIQVIAVNASLEKYVSALVEDFKSFHKKDISDTIKTGYYSPQCRKEWIVSTFVKQVKSAESIKKAIDSVPPEGGVVELLPGVHDVKETIRINKSNVAIVGTRDSEIRCSDPKLRIFIVNEKWKTNPALENVTFRGFRAGATYGLGKKSNHVITLYKVNDSAVEGISASSIYRLVATGGNGKPDGRNNRLTIRNNTVRNCMVAAVFYANDVVIAYNTVTPPPASDYGIWVEQRTGPGYLSVHHNRIERKGRGANIQTEGSNGHIFSNTLVGGHLGITIRYYPDNCRIERNVITGATSAGIDFFNQTGLRNNLVRNNRIYNCPGNGISLYDVYYGKPRGPNDIKIVNNVICNNGGDGIFGKRGTPWTVKITNNIITNNGGYGINLIHKNITETHSYNNIWSNKKGKYNEAKPGAGDISVDPLFADPSKGDFHLNSKAGRWDAKAGKWVKDKSQSPCIDAGDLKTDFSREPATNGKRVNMGAYGNTPEASRSVKE